MKKIEQIPNPISNNDYRLNELIEVINGILEREEIRMQFSVVKNITAPDYETEHLKTCKSCQEALEKSEILSYRLQQALNEWRSTDDRRDLAIVLAIEARIWAQDVIVNWYRHSNASIDERDTLLKLLYDKGEKHGDSK